MVAEKGQDHVSHRKTVYSILAIIIGMTCLAFASVPLYRFFCQITGYGGTTQQSANYGSVMLERTIDVYFNADIASNLEWEFKPSQRHIDVRIGQNALAFFTATNYSDVPLIGTSTYNVTPHKAGPYFNKIECFCFEEQRIEPGQTIEFPVSFFIDPDLDGEETLDDVRTITLSYTFFKVEDRAQ